MARVEGLVPGHHVAGHVVEILGAFAARLALGRGREIRAGHHGVDSFHGLGLAGIDGDDARVSVGAAQDLPMEHARPVHVGAEVGLAHDLVDTVVPDGAGSDPLELLLVTHYASPRISAAASRTARMILS